MTATTPHEPNGGPGLVAGTGLTALDRIRVASRSDVLEALGGSCGNVLACLGTLGHRSVPIVALGEDDAGRMVLEGFRQAGCETDLTTLRKDRRTPIIVEVLDSVRATHRFAFRDPETDAALPRWRSIDEAHLAIATPTLREAAVFYADRLSDPIVRAMETARAAGAIVVFEPASMKWDARLAPALDSVSILKLSDETVPGFETLGSKDALEACVVVRTHGADGLSVAWAGASSFLPAWPAPRLVDTCGAGDMVTTALIHTLLRRPVSGLAPRLEDILDGARLGQRLAALNCGFVGARGLFLALRGAHLRSGLDAGLDDAFVARALQHAADAGYGRRARCDDPCEA